MTAAVTLLAMSACLVVLGLLFRLLRGMPTPDPRDPSLTQLQRIGAARTQAALRLSRGVATGVAAVRAADIIPVSG